MSRDRAGGVPVHRPPLIKSLVRATVPARVRLRVHWWLVDTPGVSEAWCVIDPAMTVARVGSNTQLVIDGFARSANSYARAAFLHANPDVSISTHGHSARFARRGVKRGIPVIVLVREPRGVLASARQFDPSVPPGLVLDGYIRYYRRVIDVIDHVVVAPFYEVVDDFGAIIGRCNSRFGSSFAPYERTAESELAIAEHIEAGTGYAVPAERRDAVLPLPNPTRQLAAAADPAFDAAVERRLSVATELYVEVVRRGTPPENPDEGAHHDVSANRLGRDLRPVQGRLRQRRAVSRDSARPGR